MKTNTNLNARTLLEFANVQVAAEAFFGLKEQSPGSSFTDKIRIQMLTKGNDHSSKFIATQAAEFIKNWEVVDHISNTRTGFSGTLFEAQRDIPEAGIVILSL